MNKVRPAEDAHMYVKESFASYVHDIVKEVAQS